MLLLFTDNFSCIYIFFCQKWPTKKCCSHRALNNFKVAWTPCIKVLPGMVEPGWMVIAYSCEMKFCSRKGVWGDIPQLPRRFERERGDFFPPLLNTKMSDTSSLSWPPPTSLPPTPCHRPLEESCFIAKSESCCFHFDAKW